MRRTSKAGIELIRHFEGEVLRVYKDPVGLLTVGVGHLVKPGEPYTLGQLISREESEALLRQDLREAENAVENLVSEGLSENEFAALVSLTFNIGVSNFRKSPLLKKLNQGDRAGAANE